MSLWSPARAVEHVGSACVLCNSTISHEDGPVLARTVACGTTLAICSTCWGGHSYVGPVRCEATKEQP